MAKTILISGATAGFGLATATKFGNAGWNVIALGRRADRLTDLEQRLSGKAKLHLIEADVRSHASLERELTRLPDDFQQIDVLVNNAGLALGIEPADRANLQDWEVMVDTNIKGLLYLTRLVLPMMVERGAGHIINLGSVAGSYPYPGGNTYGSTKAFVNHFSQNLKSDLVGKNIRVTSIEPGLAETEFSVVRFKGNKEKADTVYKGTKPLTGEDIAEAIWWAVGLPAHVNVNRIELMPVCQACGPFTVVRE